MSAWSHLRSIGVAIATSILLWGCGQSGPLTLPEAADATGVQSEGTPQDDEQEEDEQD